MRLPGTGDLDSFPHFGWEGSLGLYLRHRGVIVDKYLFLRRKKMFSEKREKTGGDKDERQKGVRSKDYRKVITYPKLSYKLLGAFNA